jgi:pimeloyl-ACP methyl ester carboxylesterase
VQGVEPEELPVEGVEIEHGYVDAGGLRMHVATAGDEHGDPVVLLHGWPQHWWIWRGVIPPLVEAGYRVLCIDLRGHGWSDAPPDGYEKEQLATDVLAALDALGIERFKLIGHDWGGFAAFLIALREPQRVERFLALSIVHPWIRREGGVGQQLKALLGASYQFVLATPFAGSTIVRTLPFIDTIIKVGSGGRVPREVREAYSARFKERARARATSALYRAFLLRELQPILKGRYHDRRLTVPTVLLYGDSDRVITEERLAGYGEHADDMRVEQVPDAGHFLPDEQPALVAARALELFKAAAP